LTVFVDCAPASKLLTIKTSQDASDLSTCTAFTGNVVVAADGPENIVLDGIKTISGNVDIENVANLRSLSSTTLEAVTSFTLNNLPLMNALSFPALGNFSSLKWSALPKLTECKIATGALEGEIQEITIYNTSLKSLDWLTWPVGAALNITANANLEAFKIPYGTINVGSAITLSSNPLLKSIDVSSLSGIYGGLAISGNTLDTLSFERLQTIGGFVQLSGDYKNISMPSLLKISGALGVESTADISAFCTSLQEKRLAGHYDCTGNTAGANAPSPSENTAVPQAPTASPTSTSNESDDSSGSSTKAAIAGGVIGVFLSLLVGLGIHFYIRRRVRNQVQEILPKDSEGGSEDSVEMDSVSTSMAASRISLKELESPVVRLEMESGRIAQELPAVLPVEMDTESGGDVGGTRVMNSMASLVRHELPG
jgi:hypothetical protein